MKKLLLLGAGAIGYVLGAKAGRERYDQIAEQALKLRTNPAVQEKVDQAKSRAQETADTAKHKVEDKVAEKRAEGGPDGVSTSTTSNPTGSAGPN